MDFTLRPKDSGAPGVVVPMPTPPVPVGLRRTLLLLPPAARERVPVPVIEPVLVPVPPLATATVPEILPAVPVTLPTMGLLKVLVPAMVWSFTV